MSQLVDRDCSSWRAVRTDLTLPFSFLLPRLAGSMPLSVPRGPEGPLLVLWLIQGPPFVAASTSCPLHLFHQLD